MPKYNIYIILTVSAGKHIHIISQQISVALLDQICVWIRLFLTKREGKCECWSKNWPTDTLLTPAVPREQSPPRGPLWEETPVSGRWPALPALHNVRKHCVSFLPYSTTHSPLYFTRESERRLTLTGTQDMDLNVMSGWTESQHSHSKSHAELRFLSWSNVNQI